MIFFAEMRTLFASPRADYSSEFGLTSNNKRQQQEVDRTSRAEKTLQGEASDVTIEAQKQWSPMANGQREYY